MNDNGEQIQQPPRTARARKLAEWAFFIATMPLLILAFDWHDYHTRGKAPLWSWLFGPNPRCITQFSDPCAKLDPNNLPIGAILANGLGWLFIGFAVIGCAMLVVIAPIGLLARVTIYPHDRNAALHSRLAHSEWWLGGAVVGIGMLISAAFAFAIAEWAGWPFTSILALIGGQFISLWAAFRIEGWAMDYRHAEADAYWKAKEAEYRALDDLDEGAGDDDA